jgi:hypothetical protein
MKKILLVFDGTNFSDGAFEFANHLNRIQPLLVVAAFMPQVDYASIWNYTAAASVGVGPMYLPVAEEETAAIEKTIEHFKSICISNNNQFRVHKNFSEFSLPLLKKESRFADVVILGGEEFYKGIVFGNQFEYLKNALHVSESPVLIVPENYSFPRTNILAYDGSEESVFAIKQFAYIFPELAKNKTLLVYADAKHEEPIPSKDQIRELVAQHYSDLEIHQLGINARKYLADWAVEQKASILVSGSFGRSGLSQTFKKSFVADVIRDHQLPVFIAHR